MNGQGASTSAIPAQAGIQGVDGREALGPRLHGDDVLRSDALLQGRRVVEIHHNGEIYRLQATRLGKLILTK